MSLLTIVTQFCKRTTLPQPASVMASVDAQIQQVLGLLEEEGQDLASRGDWQGLTFEQGLATIAAEDQGAIAALSNNGYRHIKNQTIWSLTTHIPVAGPLNARQWQGMKGLTNTGPHYQFRIRGGRLLVNPIPPAGESWFFEYITKNWILDQDTTTYKQYFTDDRDTPLIPEELLLLGLRWRWKKEKGFDYAEDMRTYEMQVKDALGHDGGKPVLCMDEANRGAQPGVFIPQGNWGLP